MKKYLMMFAAVLCCAMSTESVLAQTTDWNRYCKLTSNLKTIMEYSIDNADRLYDHDSLRTGREYITYNVDIKLPELKWPEEEFDTLTALYTFGDFYGREIMRLDASKEVLEIVNEFVRCHTYGDATSGDKDFLLPQGGDYEFRIFFDFLNIDRRYVVTVHDEPSVRVKGNFVVKTGDDFNFKGYYNTGYPYDINSLTGDEYADVTIYKMETESTGREAFKHRFPLHLKDETHPLLAGWDSLLVNIEKPEIGHYMMRLETNWDGIATRDISLDVVDTLRASIALDKDAYDLASDKQATMHMTMDYGYPYIHEVEPDIIPTIRVAATLLKDKEATDFLMSDTLKLVSDTMAIKNLNYIGEWNLDLSKIDASKLTEGSSTYQLKVNIIFNNEQQYETFLPVDLKAVATGISHVTAPRTDNEPVFTLDGIRVDTSKPLPQGIYIQKGKKISIN